MPLDIYILLRVELQAFLFCFLISWLYEQFSSSLPLVVSHHLNIIMVSCCTKAFCVINWLCWGHFAVTRRWVGWSASLITRHMALLFLPNYNLWGAGDLCLGDFFFNLCIRPMGLPSTAAVINFNPVINTWQGCASLRFYGPLQLNLLLGCKLQCRGGI